MVTIGLTGTAPVQAITLERMVIAADLSRIASAVQIDAASFLPTSLSIEPAQTALDAPSTEFRVCVPEECNATIEVSDATGQLVSSATLRLPAGWQKIGFSGRGIDGQPLANGTYRYSVLTGQGACSARVIIQR